MKKNKIIVLTILVLCCSSIFGFGKKESSKIQKSISGEIININLSMSQIKILSAKGDEFLVNYSSKTILKKIPPGAVSLEKAEAINLNALSEGDRLLALGKVDEVAKTVEAIQIIVVSSKDLTDLSLKNKEEWNRDGIFGEIVAVDVTAKQATVKINKKELSETITLKFSDSSQIKRFSNNSVAYKDTIKVSIDNIKPSDLFRALVIDKGNGIKEVREILVGSFQLNSGTVMEIDYNAQQLKVKELVSGQVMTVVLNKSTYTRTFTKEFSELINETLKKKNATLPADLGQQIKKMSVVNFAGIKKGDMVLFNSLAAEKSEKVSAIYLFTGVEPFLLPIQKNLQASKNNSNFKLGLPEGLNNLVLGL
jgi:exosome complex RNA-binding protein Csl4